MKIVQKLTTKIKIDTDEKNISSKKPLQSIKKSDKINSFYIKHESSE